MELAAPRGTRDFYPDDMRFRNWLFGQFREVARLYAFEEYDAPVVEHEALYVRKAGEEITEQLYTFVDKSDRKLALRPEMTPSLARLVLQKGGSLSLPIRWFSLPQCWRYERTTRGRKREHYQWNMDIFGVDDVSAEVELLSAIKTFFERVGLSAGDVGLRVSSRKVIEAIMTKLKVPADKLAPVCVIVDKMAKVPRETIEEDLAKLGVSKTVIDALIACTTVKNLRALSEQLGSGSEAVVELTRLFELGASYGLEPWLELDTSIVRGLAYYTGVVFEGFDRGATLRAICGGGRYDKLLSTFGGADIPACGFGFGDVVIAELLSDKRKLPALARDVNDIVFAMGEAERSVAMQIADHLRKQARSVEVVLDARKTKWVFKHADAVAANRVLILGSDELAAGVVTVRDMKAGNEAKVALSTFGVKP